MPIIDSRLQTDLYKINMQQVVHSQFPNTQVRYEFKNRSVGVDLSRFVEEIEYEIHRYTEAIVTPSEQEYLYSIPYLKGEYVNALANLRLNPLNVKVSVDPKAVPEDRLSIVVEGNWFNTIEFEVPILAIVNELYFQEYSRNEIIRETGRTRLADKIKKLQEPSHAPVHLIEFGTRRRFSKAWQEYIVNNLAKKLGDQDFGNSKLLGTSNVYLAMKYNLKPYGTMAHEFLQACQAFAPLHEFQKYALDCWMQEYRGDLGIALSDVVGMKAFLKDFDKLFCKAYDGCRHDSGDPYEWGERLIAHYQKMGIDPTTKIAVFSDGLDIDKALHLASHFQGRIKTSFGIGTSLTNDLGVIPLSIVMKMTHCNGRPVAKLSDSPGKLMCKDAIYLNYLRSIYPE